MQDIKLTHNAVADLRKEVRSTLHSAADDRIRGILTDIRDRMRDMPVHDIESELSSRLRQAFGQSIDPDPAVLRDLSEAISEGRLVD